MKKCCCCIFFVFENLKNTATKCGKWPAPKDEAVRGCRGAPGRGAPCSLGRANGAMVVVVGLCQARLASRTERCVNDARPTDGRGGVAMGGYCLGMYFWWFWCKKYIGSHSCEFVIHSLGKVVERLVMEIEKHSLAEWVTTTSHTFHIWQVHWDTYWVWTLDPLECTN